MLRKIYHHCELEMEDEALEEQAGKISPPEYYKPDFSNEEIDMIDEETRDTVERIQDIISSEIG